MTRRELTNNANLSCVQLANANLTNADLSQTNLSYADLRDVKVENTRFRANMGLSEEMKLDLKHRGAIFLYD